MRYVRVEQRPACIDGNENRCRSALAKLSPPAVEVVIVFNRNCWPSTAGTGIVASQFAPQLNNCRVAAVDGRLLSQTSTFWTKVGKPPGFGSAVRIRCAGTKSERPRCNGIVRRAGDFCGWRWGMRNPDSLGRGALTIDDGGSNCGCQGQENGQSDRGRSGKSVR